MEAALNPSPAVSPAAAAALLEEGDAAFVRCKKLLPPSWAALLKGERRGCWAVAPIIERHLQRSPNAWQAAVRQEALGQAKRQLEREHAKTAEGLPCCDGCGQPAPELKWCACRLKRYCGRECQKRDFPAHKAECKAARRGIPPPTPRRRPPDLALLLLLLLQLLLRAFNFLKRCWHSMQLQGS